MSDRSTPPLALKVGAAIGAFILTLDAAALIIVFGMAAPDAPKWVGPLALIAFASAAVVVGVGAAVIAWQKIAEAES